MIKKYFKIKGLNCGACVKICQLKIGKLARVKDLTIDLKTGQSQLVSDHEISINEINNALKGTDFSASD